MESTQAIHPQTFAGLSDGQKRQVVGKSFSEPNIPLIILNAAAIFGTTEKEIQSQSRKHETCLARFAIIKILRDRFNQTYSSIGKVAGNRYHATCINGLRSFNSDIEHFPEVAELYSKFEKAVKFRIDPTWPAETVGSCLVK